MENTELKWSEEQQAVVRRVESWERVELAQVQGEVDNAQAAVEATNEELAAVEARRAELEAQKSAQESALEDAKRGLEAYNAAAPAQPESDAQPEDGSAEVPADGSGEAVAVPVTVETTDEY